LEISSEAPVGNSRHRLAPTGNANDRHRCTCPHRATSSSGRKGLLCSWVRLRYDGVASLLDLSGVMALVASLLYTHDNKRASARLAPTVVDPFAQQRGLAKAGRGGDEGELALVKESRVQPFEQARARNQPCPEHNQRIRPRGGMQSLVVRRDEAISHSLAALHDQVHSSTRCFRHHSLITSCPSAQCRSFLSGEPCL